MGTMSWHRRIWEAASEEAAQSHRQTQRSSPKRSVPAGGGDGVAGPDTACVRVCVPACATVPARAALRCFHGQ